MNALTIIIPVYIVLFIVYGLKDVKKFLLFTGIFTLPFRTTYSIINMGPYTGWISGIIISLSDISFISLLVYNSLSNNKNRVTSRINISILLFISACLLSGINSEWRRMTFYQIIMVTQIVILYYFVFVKSIQTEKDLHSVVWFLTISLLFQSIMANLQFFTGHVFDFTSTGRSIDQLMALNDETGINRAFGTIGSPNGFAEYIVPLLIVNISLLMGTGENRKARIIAIIIGSLSLIFSFSRGGWVSYVISFFILFIISIRKKVINPKILFVVLFVTLIIVLIFSSDIAARLFGDDHNAAGSRIPLIKIAFNMIKEHPIIGVGANTFRSVIHQYTKTPDLQGIYLHQVHNQFLLVFAETGLIGLLAFIYLLYSLLKESSYCIKQDRNRYIYFLGIGIRVAIISAGIHMMVDLYNTYLHLASLFIYAGLLTASKNILKNSVAEVKEASLTDNSQRLLTFDVRTNL